MGFCPKCGTKADDGTRFCGKCGANLGEPIPEAPRPTPNPVVPAPPSAQTAVATPPAPPTQQAAPPKSSGGGCGKAVIIVLVVVGLIAVLVIGGFVYVGYKAKKKYDQVKEAVNSGDVNDVANVLSGNGPAKAADAMPTYPDWSSAGSSAVQPGTIPPATQATSPSGGAAEKSMGQVLPMRKGLLITTAIQQSMGDYESMKEITSVTNEGVAMDYSADNIPEAPNPFATDEEKAAAKNRKRSVHSSRNIRAADLQSSHEYAENFGESMPLVIANTTALGISSATLNDLLTKGETPFTYQDTGLKGALGGLLGGIAGMADQMKKDNGQPSTSDDAKARQALKDLQSMGKVNCTLKREDQKIHAFPVLLNGERVLLPAIRASCKSDGGSTAEFYFLNDPQNPLSLTWKVGKSDRLQVVKLEYVQETAAGGGGGKGAKSGGVGADLASSAGAKELEQKLEQQEKVRIYGIYFDFASAQIKPQSKPTLDEIAAVMNAHPDWKLNVGGHTDNIGGDSFNLQLSQQRAEAVKAALVSQYGISTDRLMTAGYGASSPVETNDTMEGRARNRRVELSKQ